MQFLNDCIAFAWQRQANSAKWAPPPAVDPLARGGETASPIRDGANVR